MAMPKDGSQAVNSESNNQKQGKSGSMGQNFHRKFNSNPKSGNGINRPLKTPKMSRGGSAKNKTK